jgi:membrane-bound lytic murein transglycosylase B
MASQISEDRSIRSGYYCDGHRRGAEMKPKRMTFFIVISLMCLLFVFSFVQVALAKNDLDNPSFSRADRSRLVDLFDDGAFDKAFLQKVFFDPRLKKLPVAVDRNVVNVENKDNYANFLNPYSIQLASRFARKWRTTLRRASQQFGVDQEVLVAILLVETGFGNILGRFSVISVFSSIVIENERFSLLCREHDTDICHDTYRQRRLQQKAEWARGELLALLVISDRAKSCPFQLKGSYAGAFGIPQFLPSSYLKWGYDSDQSGSANLFLFPDAIYSVANYLQSHGWQKGLHREENKDVIWTYNRSRIYVDTVHGVAVRIRQLNERQKPDTQDQPTPEYADGTETDAADNPS